jgi:BRCT domain type II-containing protein
MKALIVAHGGKNSGSISGKTSYLIAGEKAGPEKLKKAESLGVKIISENEFYSLTEQDNNENIRNTSSSDKIDGRGIDEEVSVTNPTDEPTLF